MTTQAPQSHEINQFVKFGKEMLEQTERPNIITIEQFVPYIPIFAPDKERLEKDLAYREAMTRLMHDYRVKLAINPYYPTLVVNHMAEPRTVVLFLDRWFSRIRSDNMETNSHRDSVPLNVAKISGDHRDALILNASIKDIMSTNSDPEQSKIFQRNRAESALMLKIFVENNLPQEKREAFLAKYGPKTDEEGLPDAVSSTTSSSSSAFGLDDDED